MKTSRLNTLPLIVFGLAITLAGTASAARDDHSPELMEVLSAIDTVPTRAQLESLGDDVPAMLFDAAADAELGLYQRRRATSLLSVWPTTRTAAWLKWLAASTSERKLRWIAAYTYMHSFAKAEPKQVMDYAETLLKSPIRDDRDAAVRALRFVPGKRADALLEAAEDTETDRRLLGAIRRVRSLRQ